MTNDSTIKSLQNSLNCLGYDCGKADGINGPLFRHAMQVFERDHPEFTGITNPNELQHKMLPLLHDKVSNLAKSNNTWNAKETAAFQSGVTAFGIETGSIDGIKGPKTKMALHQFC